MHRMTIFSIQYWEGFQGHIVTIERNQSHTTCQTDYMVGSITKVWILIIYSHNQAGTEQVWASKKLFFDRKLLFSKTLV